MSPKVFVSHASEDKERFVINFATRLRAKGIDAWLDKWEMLPGDSLVNKIFDDGIKNAQSVIIVISKNSIKKPWVREELNASIVKRINSGIKLIPVVIDDCKIPECLQSTLYEKIQNINSYDEELDNIKNAIFGHNDKPQIGQPPKYVNTIIDKFTDLTKTDSIIFKACCDMAIEKNNTSQMVSIHVFDKISKYEISESDFYESLDILDRKGYIDATKIPYGNIHFFDITIYGFSKYINLHIKDFDKIIEQVCYLIVNGSKDSGTIASQLKKDIIIINHAFDLLQQRDLIKFQETIGNRFLFDVSPELKRMLK